MSISTDPIDHLLDAAVAAGPAYAALDGDRRAEFLTTIASDLQESAEALLAAANRETSLGEQRLRSELARTTGQLLCFADLVADGSWAAARIDTGPPDIRRLLVPLGPVVVFGASNFPLAFSVPGGDTTAALAAGCPVVCKAHPAHPDTSAIAAAAIDSAARRCDLPAGVFAVVADTSVEAGQRLVADDRVEAVAFTGSLRGGRAIFDIASGRLRPIPVYAEMGSINPVFVLPAAAVARGVEIAAELADSITLGVGQFCTKPGVVVTSSGSFGGHLADAMAGRQAATMLTSAIADRYVDGLTARLATGATLVAGSVARGQPALVSLDTSAFVADPTLQQEVFGPVSLLVTAASEEEMLEVARSLDGQLTGTVYATDDELADHTDLLTALAARVGRLVANSVPTGVVVNTAMQHGGPYPASTDSRTTSVGTAAIERFVRPICYQNFPDAAMPALLRNANPIGAARLVDGLITRDPITIAS